MKRPWVSFTVFLVSLLAAAPLAAQPAASAYRVVDVHLTSGPRSNQGPAPAVTYSAEVDAGQAHWIRLQFGPIALSKQSYIRVTSQRDGQSQILDREALVDWQYSTAFFNGGAVKVELVSDAQSGVSSVSILRAYASDPDAPAIEPYRVCHQTDNRIPAGDAGNTDPNRNNNAMATVRLIGLLNNGNQVALCTGFITDKPARDNANNRFLASAGHCFDSNDPPICSIAEVPRDQNANPPLNVEGATSNVCVVTHTVANQFPIIWGRRGVFTNAGNDELDWAVFYCGKVNNQYINQRQNGSQLTVTKEAAPDSTDVRIYGYGVDGPGNTANPHCTCNPNVADATQTRSQINQTATGKVTRTRGQLIDHYVHTCGANSGSPVIKLGTSDVIAIHIGGNCTGNPTPDNHAVLMTEPTLNKVLGGFSVPLLDPRLISAVSTALALAGGLMVSRRRRRGIPV